MMAAFAGFGHPFEAVYASRLQGSLAEHLSAQEVVTFGPCKRRKVAYPGTE